MTSHHQRKPLRVVMNQKLKFRILCTYAAVSGAHSSESLVHLNEWITSLTSEQVTCALRIVSRRGLCISPAWSWTVTSAKNKILLQCRQCEMVSSNPEDQTIASMPLHCSLTSFELHKNHKCLGRPRHGSDISYERHSQVPRCRP